MGGKGQVSEIKHHNKCEKHECADRRDLGMMLSESLSLKNLFIST